MAMVNSLTNVKDSRWLQLEVCREFQRNKCTRPDTECKFAHPPANVEVQNGRVIACYDSTKGRCNREKPPCKYFHPPEHLKNQLLINGRNHLVLKNALLQQLPLQPVLPAAVVSALPSLLYAPLAHQQRATISSLLNVISSKASTNPYLANLPAMATTSFNPYLTPTPMMPGMVPADAMAAPLSVVPTPLVASQKVSRTDRLEIPSAEQGVCGTLFQAFPGMVPYTKRPALDKSGIPVYQPSTAAYQQALAMQVQQPFVPVSFAGHPTSLPRF
ncbi:protein muscleblind-like isoform X5 [Centruroides vittatus]|uniref:protein muscleblind-like isoform X5 n=1 Tax=Centruroides vittatus TaxID=120091 RepID=UPI00350F3417